MRFRMPSRSVALASFSLLLLLPVSAGSEPARTPVLVELFTSQGCRSCPPADALLSRLEPQVFVLSEHVDYWDFQGWRDPFSSAKFTDRQVNYARRFNLSSSYTLQMVVDGRTEFNGSDSRRAQQAIQQSARERKLEVRVTRNGGQVLVEAPERPKKAELWVAVAQRAGSADVVRGENSGRTLRHVNIVRSLVKAGAVSRYEMAVSDPASKVVAFVQEAGQGRILGVGGN